MATPNYKHPNLKQQLGLAEDPNGSDHVITSKGHRLTRTVTAGGHDVDSSQPGFPVYHRRIGNPFPLMCIATGASIMMLGFVCIGYRGISNPRICEFCSPSHVVYARFRFWFWFWFWFCLYLSDSILTLCFLHLVLGFQLAPCQS